VLVLAHDTSPHLPAHRSLTGFFFPFFFFPFFFLPAFFFAFSAAARALSFSCSSSMSSAVLTYESTGIRRQAQQTAGGGLRQSPPQSPTTPS
jgi:hypothetical protein